MSLLRGGEGWLDRHRGRVLVLWLAALFAFTADTGNTLVLRQDAHGYYVYLPQLFFGAWEDPAWADVGAVYRDPETGRYRSKYTYGTALFHAPFFACGHLGAVWSGAERNGRSMPYRLALLISGAFWMTLGCGLVYRFLRPKVGFGMALVVPTLLWAGTSLFYYSAFMPGYSHAVSFFLVAAFTGASLHALRHPSWGAFAGNGVLLGLILAVRPTNGLVLLWPLLWGVYGWGALGDRLAWLGRHAGKALAGGLIAAAFLLPQLLYWRHTTGSWGWAAYPGEGFTHAAAPRVGAVLFHVRNGLLVYAPVLAVALVGIGRGLWRRDPFAPAAFGVFVAFTWLFGSWWAWWFGGAFGHRAYVDVLPMLALPMGLSLAALRRAPAGWRAAGWTLVVLLVAYTFLLTYRYDPPWDGTGWDRGTWWAAVRGIWGG